MPDRDCLAHVHALAQAAPSEIVACCRSSAAPDSASQSASVRSPGYGVRVLAPGSRPAACEIRMFVVDYDVERWCHAELPGDAGFFLSLLWQSADDRGGSLADFFTWRKPENDGWLAVNTRWFVESVERVAVRNHPLHDEGWEHIGALQQEGIHQRDNGWPDEDRLVRADYEVQVTDARWLEHLRPGLSRQL
jgi:hypothetical protein